MPPWAVPARIVQEDHRLPLLLLLFHVPLGLLLYNLGPIGLLHPLLVFLIGLRRALRPNETLRSVAWVVAYIVGAEIIWRMAGVPIFWEFGKYGGSFIMLVAIVRRRLWQLPVFPTAYFLVLLPACLITLLSSDFSSSRDRISFNMSGPLLLFVGSWFFSNVNLTGHQLRKVIFAVLLPLVSAATAALIYTVTANDIQFNGESNFATSGGFGPNQVSAMLGLGMFLSVASFLLFENTVAYRLCYVLLAVFLGAQATLTFSRGGIYNAVGAILVMSVFLMPKLKVGIGRLLPVGAVALLFLVIIFPSLNDFTGGALQDRFEEVDTTGRTEIVGADIEIFKNNPILGLGVGEAYEGREAYLGSRKAVSHTEFTRMLAEHGSFGLLGIFCIALMVLHAMLGQRSAFGRAFVGGFAMLSILMMSNTGMRMAAPAFTLSILYAAVFDFADKLQNANTPNRPRFF